jgi:hypothetical protein
VCSHESMCSEKADMALSPFCMRISSTPADGDIVSAEPLLREALLSALHRSVHVCASCSPSRAQVFGFPICIEDQVKRLRSRRRRRQVQQLDRQSRRRSQRPLLEERATAQGDGHERMVEMRTTEVVLVESGGVVEVASAVDRC